jgi:hypothetical protein
MAKVYRISGLSGAAYFNTRREADQFKPGGEEPEGFERLDAAKECNRLLEAEYQSEREVSLLRRLLFGLRDICPTDAMEENDRGRDVLEYCEANPWPPATASDRDGQRSYGV